MTITLNGTTGITTPALTNSGALTQTGAATLSSTLQAATTIGVGGATPASSGAGITFPATASASSDANTLDDYEEGTFTPTLGGASGSSYTYATQIGSYTKIGRIVYFNLHIKLNINTAGTGNLYFDGLPFTVGTWHPVNIWFSRVAFGSVVVSPLAWSASPYVYITTNTSNGDYNYLTATTVGTGTDKEFRCSGFYYVS